MGMGILMPSFLKHVTMGIALMEMDVLPAV